MSGASATIRTVTQQTTETMKGTSNLYPALEGVIAGHVLVVNLKAGHR